MNDLFRLFPDLPRAGRCWPTNLRDRQDQRLADVRERARLTTARQRAKVEVNRGITDGRRDAVARLRRKR